MTLPPIHLPLLEIEAEVGSDNEEHDHLVKTISSHSESEADSEASNLIDNVDIEGEN